MLVLSHFHYRDKLLILVMLQVFRQGFAYIKNSGYAEGSLYLRFSLVSKLIHPLLNIRCQLSLFLSWTLLKNHSWLLQRYVSPSWRSLISFLPLYRLLQQLYWLFLLAPSADRVERGNIPPISAMQSRGSLLLDFHFCKASAYGLSSSAQWLLITARYLQPSTRAAYEIFARKKGIRPETIGLKHGVLGHWVGTKEAKNILVYFHGTMTSSQAPKLRNLTGLGGGFALPAAPEYFDFFSTMVEALNTAGGDIAVFFLSYTLTPHATYPTQIRQAVEGVRYIVTETGHSPSNVIIGGDSAGGNLVLAVLSHISHPHSEIEALELFEPLAGAVAIAPWISFETDWPSMKANRHKDIVASALAKRWSQAYLGGLAGHDYYNEPIIAPADWWKGIKAKEILVLAGGDEVLLSSIQKFTETLQVRMCACFC